MSNADKYNGSAPDILVALNEQKPEVWELFGLIRSALINNNDNLLNALLEYKQSNEDTLDFQRNDILSRFSLEEIKQHSSKIGLFLSQIRVQEEANNHSLSLDLILKYNTKEYDEQTGFVITNKEKAKLKHQYIKEAFEKHSQPHNSLTIYHDAGHAFIKLECAECSDGMPAILAAGLYPPNEEEESMCYLPGMNPEHDDDSSPHLNNGLYGLIALPFMKSSFGLGSYYYGMRPFSYAKFPKSGAEFLGIRHKTNSYNVHPDDKYSLNIEHISFVANSWYHIEHTHSYEDFDNVYRKSFNISTEAATKVLERICYLANHCDNSYQYHGLKNNCLDFAQHIYSLSGLPGDHFNEMHPDGYPLNMLGVYKAFIDLQNWADEFYNGISQTVEFLWD